MSCLHVVACSAHLGKLLRELAKIRSLRLAGVEFARHCGLLHRSASGGLPHDTRNCTGTDASSTSLHGLEFGLWQAECTAGVFNHESGGEHTVGECLLQPTPEEKGDML